jgi:hypothetical protein
MKSITYIISIISCSAFLNGCAMMDRSSISYNDVTSRLFVWKANYSAGVGSENKICVQGALTDKATTADLAAALETTAKVADARAVASFGQAVIALNPSNAQTTYASDAYFALCQLTMNNPDLSTAQIASMFNSIGKTAINIDKSAAELKTLNAPEITSVVKDVLTDFGVAATTEDIKEKVENKLAETAGEN